MTKLIRPPGLILPRGIRKPSRPAFDPSHPLSKGLVGYWHLGDVKQTGAIHDLVSNNALTIANGPFLFNLQSHNGGEASYINNGVANQNLTAPNGIQTYPFSVSGWFTHTTGTVVVGSLSINASIWDGWYLAASTSAGWTFNSVSNTTFATGAVGANTRAFTWDHVVGVATSATSRTIYVNGVQGTVDTSSSTPARTDHQFIAGQSGVGANSWEGGFDALRFYSRALTAQDVLQLYAEPYPGINAQAPYQIIGPPSVALPCGGNTFGQNLDARQTQAQAAIVAMTSQRLGTPPRLNLLKDSMYGPPGMVADYDCTKPVLPQSSVVCLTTGPPYQGMPMPLRLSRPFAQRDWTTPVPPASRQAALLAQPVGVPYAFYLGADKFFGLGGAPKFDWPNPVAARLVASSQQAGLFALQLAAPFAKVDWPNPVAVRTSPSQLPGSSVAALSPVVVAPFAQYDWPNPGRTTRSVDTQGDGAFVALFPAPFAQLDWPVPRAAARASFAQSQALTALQLATPFAQLDWPNPEIAKFARQELLPSLPLETETVVPFAKTDWPNPAIARIVASSQQAGLVALQLATPFAKTDWPNPAIAKFVRQELLPPLPLEAETVAPFAKIDWPNPSVIKFVGQVFPPSSPPKTGTAAPFAQLYWPNPTVARPVASSHQAGLFSLHLSQPFGKTDWPNPAIGSFAKQAFPSARPPTTPPAQPFAKTDWPNPVAVKVAAQVFPASLPLEVETVAPFAKTDWPNPATIKFAGQVFQTQPPIPAVPFAQFQWLNPVVARAVPVSHQAGLFALALGQPFAQLDWPNPAIVRFAGQVFRSSLPPTPPVPFVQLDWPNPIVVKFASQGVQWQRPPVPPVPLPAPCTEIVFGVIDNPQVAITARIESNPATASGIMLGGSGISGSMDAPEVAIAATIDDAPVAASGSISGRLEIDGATSAPLEVVFGHINDPVVPLEGDLCSC